MQIFERENFGGNVIVLGIIALVVSIGANIFVFGIITIALNGYDKVYKHKQTQETNSVINRIYPASTRLSDNTFVVHSDFGTIEFVVDDFLTKSAKITKQAGYKYFTITDKNIFSSINYGNRMAYGWSRGPYAVLTDMSHSLSSPIVCTNSKPTKKDAENTYDSDKIMEEIEGKYGKDHKILKSINTMGADIINR